MSQKNLKRKSNNKSNKRNNNNKVNKSIKTQKKKIRMLKEVINQSNKDLIIMLNIVAQHIQQNL